MKLSRAALELPLAPPWRKLLKFEVLDSTQRHALRLAAAGEDLRGLALWADRQESGRGRLDHAWVSEPGGLYVTAGLPYDLPLKPADTGWISLIGALASVEALRGQLGLTLRIKWPNDLLIEGRKVGGLLGEVLASAPRADGSRGRVILIGHGLNWLNRIGPAAKAGGFSAASLCEFKAGLTLAGREIFIRAWLEQLNAWRNLLLRGYNEALTVLGEAVEAILWKKGEPVRLTNTEKGVVDGVLLGLGPGGAARLRLEDGQEVQACCGWHSEVGQDTARSSNET